MRGPELYGFIITIAIYFIIIKEYRRELKIRRRKNEIQNKTFRN